MSWRFWKNKQAEPESNKEDKIADKLLVCIFRLIMGIMVFILIVAFFNLWYSNAEVIRKIDEIKEYLKSNPAVTTIEETFKAYLERLGAGSYGILSSDMISFLFQIIIIVITSSGVYIAYRSHLNVKNADELVKKANDKVEKAEKRLEFITDSTTAASLIQSDLLNIYQIASWLRVSDKLVSYDKPGDKQLFEEIIEERIRLLRDYITKLNKKLDETKENTGIEKPYCDSLMDLTGKIKRDMDNLPSNLPLKDQIQDIIITFDKCIEILKNSELEKRYETQLDSLMS